MNKQEYKLIRNLAWDLLIDANISQLPVDISAIAALYNLQHMVDSSKSLYDNTLFTSEYILKIFGITDPEFKKYLAVRILSPMIVLKELNIKSAEEMSDLSGIPINLAQQRFERLKILLKRNTFETSHLETIVLSQFHDWLNKNRQIMG